MHLGMIGGIGPASTVAYYQRLSAGVREAGGVLDLTIVNADVNELIRNNDANDKQAQAKAYANLIDRLKHAGAECAAITSLGGHFCFEDTVALASLPMISAVTPLDAYFAKNGMESVGLMGTKVVMQTQLYGQLSHTKALVPDTTLEAVGDTYIDMALASHCTDTQRTFFIEEGQKLIDKGADAIVLAGTDLSLAFDGRNVGYKVVDALDVHVSLLTDIALGHADLNEHSARLTQ
ncbi:MAG: aspartate/glutamate racemase family protein [Tateyamaria sp.]|uniref:aspartate/glutamate racemase family protein n=1 Tax=Tateyamaria sp. TaxID=1929288 RepID=UPI00329C7C71